MIMVVFIMLCCGALGVLIGEEMTRVFPDGTPKKDLILWLFGCLAMLYVNFFLHTALHEAGHGLFGLLSGYRFVSYRIGSLMWVRKKDGIHLFRYSLPGTAGQCLMDPPAWNDGRFPLLLYNMGGAIVNLLLGLISLVAFFFVNHGFLRVFLLESAFIGFFLALLNGVPLPAALLNNDGSNAREAMSSIRARRAFWIQMRISAVAAEDVRPKDQPEEWFELPAREETESSALIASLAVFRANRLMDEHRFEEADELMKSLLEHPGKIPQIYQYLLASERLFCELISENRPEEIEKLYTKELKAMLKQMETQISILRTKYAYAKLFQKDPQECAKIRRKLDRMLESYPFEADKQSERELLEIVDAAE